MSKQRLLLLVSCGILVTAIGASLFSFRQPEPKPGDRTVVSPLDQWCHTDDLSWHNLDRDDAIFAVETGRECCLTGGAALRVVGLAKGYVLAELRYPEIYEIYPGRDMQNLEISKRRLVECRAGEVISLRTGVFKKIVRSWNDWVARERSDDARYASERQRAKDEQRRVREEYRRSMNKPAERPLP